MGEIGVVLEAGVNIIGTAAKAAEASAASTVPAAVAATEGAMTGAVPAVAGAVESSVATGAAEIAAETAGQGTAAAESVLAEEMASAAEKAVGGTIGEAAPDAVNDGLASIADVNPSTVPPSIEPVAQQEVPATELTASTPEPEPAVAPKPTESVAPEPSATETATTEDFSFGEQAARTATELGQANRNFTDALKAGKMSPKDAERASQLRQKLDELRIRQMKRSRESDNKKEKKDEEWEVVKKGNKVVIRRRKPGFKRAVGDAVSNLAADVANDAGKKS